MAIEGKRMRDAGDPAFEDPVAEDRHAREGHDRLRDGWTFQEFEDWRLHGQMKSEAESWLKAPPPPLPPFWREVLAPLVPGVLLGLVILGLIIWATS